MTRKQGAEERDVLGLPSETVTPSRRPKIGMLLRTCVAPALALVLLIAPHSNALAQDDPFGAPGPTKEWDVTLGGGVAVRPTFEGSDRYRVTPMPMLNIKWNDSVSFGPDGLNAYWHDGAVKAGAGLTFDPGRADKGTGILTAGDDRLSGLGTIDPAVGFKAFGEYKAGQVIFGSSVTQFAGADNHGALVNARIATPLPVSDQLMLMGSISADWADKNYMQTIFGVTSLQASRSRFTQFNARAGVKDVGVGLNAIYRIDGNWSVSTMAQITELTGDAAKSPITFSNTNGTVATMLGYHF
jgi:outer membrane scaffolding protein for murein synthesis (MipA/OmpV family)